MHAATQNEITLKLFALLDSAGVPHLKLEHPPSRTSDESRRVRKAASGLDTVGAKALVQKMTGRNKDTSIAVFVLPGQRKFDTKMALEHLPEVKRMRFLSSDEVYQTTALEVGAIPPFGRRLFPQVARLFFDSALLDCELLGFNAAAHQQSIIIKPSDLVTAAEPDDIFPFSVNADL
jgi:prolyl-tRNA editing enzyme YbaK/EbsC (Cys-tRNA(Pro) deacylase)